MEKLRRYIEKNEIKTALALIILGAALRLLFISSFPPGLNQDEASAGYEAWSLLHYGMDRNGCSWPVLFISWGSGQNVLYSYLSIPFIAILGLNEVSLRLAMGLYGSVSLPLFWLMARRINGKFFGLSALLILALNPWHITASRWALESNLLPFFILLGLYFLTQTDKKPRMLIISAAILAISLYSYGTAFIFLPFLLVFASIALLKQNAVGPRVYIISLCIFIIIALPVAVCNLRNILGFGELKVFGITLPKLTETRQSAVSVFGGGGTAGIFNNFKKFLSILITQSDGLPWNSAGAFGLLYGPVGMLLSILGLVDYISKLIRKTAKSNEIYIFLALISSFTASFIIDANINRMNMVFIPLIWYQAEGIIALFRVQKWTVPALAAVILLAGVMFTKYYFTAYACELAPYFFEGLGDAIKYADSLDNDKIWVTYDVNMPYIYVLFYNQYPTDKFSSSVSYLNPDGAFRMVNSFGKYCFGTVPPEDTICIVKTSDNGNMTVLGTFGYYSVVKR